MTVTAHADDAARPHVAVVGGGIAGLAAAQAVRHSAGERVRVTVLEASPRVGGKLATTEVAGTVVDSGAEQMLARRPEGVALAEAVGLADRLVHPASAGAALWSRERLRPLPAGQLMGVPTDLRALAASSVLSPWGLARVPLDLVLPATPVDDDVAVGWYLRRRLGDEVVDRLVEPLLGGVYAGRADLLSLDATMPQLAAEVRTEPSALRAAAHAAGPSTPGVRAPAFASLAGGLGQLPAAVASASRATVRTSATVRELRPTPDGRWRLVVGPARAPETLTADAVVLAVPAAPAARLLQPVAPAAAAALAAVEYASMALVTFAVPYAQVAGRLHGTGFLVPPVEGRAVKAATYASAKWPWIADAAPGLALVRTSLGRHGEVAVLQRDDDELAALALADLSSALGRVLAPVDQVVSRWGGGLPQYAVGHLDLVERVRRSLAGHPGLAVCGAAYDGVGVPACVASGRTAADRVLAHLAAGREWPRG
jgi:oxygen-dependent protoporphyrinogen oxidase